MQSYVVLNNTQVSVNGSAYYVGLFAQFNQSQITAFNISSIGTMAGNISSSNFFALTFMSQINLFNCTTAGAVTIIRFWWWYYY